MHLTKKASVGLYFFFYLVTLWDIFTEFPFHLLQLFKMFIFVIWVNSINYEMRKNKETDDQDNLGS